MDVGTTIARKARAMGREIEGAGRSAVGRAAFATKGSIEKERGRVTRSGRLRNVGRKGARLGVRYDVKGKYNPTALIKATGPWQLIERDTKAHEIKPRRGRGRAKGRRGLKLPGGWVGGVKRHPGTKGRKPFERGVEKSIPEVNKIISTAHKDAVARGFKS